MIQGRGRRHTFCMSRTITRKRGKRASPERRTILFWWSERNRFADRGIAPCGGDGASTGKVVPTSARQVIGSDFSSPAR